MQDPSVQRALNDLLDAAKNAKPEHSWYFYSNSPRFAEYFEKKQKLLLENPQKGALLLMDEAAEKAGLNRTVFDIANYLKASFIFVDGDVPVDINPPRSEVSRALILNLKAAGKTDRQQISAKLKVTSELQKADPKNTKILFMMPETKQEATAWGFPDEKADQYVTNGERILRDLKRYGFDESVDRVKSRQSSLDSIRSSYQAGKTIVIVGEADKGGGVLACHSESAVASEYRC